MLTYLLLMAQIAAFPGAQGGGAQSVGGRGGVVMEVTNTNDSGAGSRRACIQATGPRTCIYRVAGIFPVTSGDVFAGSPFLTDACHTAPGEVLIGGPNANGAALRISTHDVIIRGCVFSPDNAATVSGPDTGTVGITIVNCPGVSPVVSENANAGCRNIMIDHVTTRWSGNKSEITTSNFTPGMNGNGNGTGPNHAITVQYTLHYEPHEGHPVGYGTATDETCVGTRANGNCLSPWETDIDYHHNLFANTHHRIPENSNGSTRWSNNIIFNWGWYANEFLGAEIIDTINNKYTCGNLNTLGAQKYPIHFTTNSPEMSGPPSVYVAGNIGCGQTAPPADQYGSLVNQITGENGNEIGPIPPSWTRAAPMPDPPFPIVLDPATNLDTAILPTVGASQHLDCDGNWVSHRDPQDARIINQYKAGAAGGYWPNGVTFTGQPTFPPPTASWQDAPVVNGTLCVESLHDGIPDQWKKAKGLSLTDPNLYKTVSPNGYTWLEVYLAGSGVTPPPINPVSPNGATITPTTGGSLTDAGGNTWTFGANVPVSSNPDCSPLSCGNVIQKNGAALTGTAATLLLWYNNFIYQENASGNWWQYNGNFVKVGGDPRPPVTPVVTSVTVICTPSSIAPTGTSSCAPTVQGSGAFNPAVTWSAIGGSVTTSGVASPVGGSASIVVTATSVQTPSVSGKATVQVTTTPPTTFQLNCTIGTNNQISCSGVMP